MRRGMGLAWLLCGVAGCMGPGEEGGQYYEVQVVSAAVAPDDNGLPWDPDGSPPDVKVTLTCPGRPPTVTTEVESFAPTFGTGACSASRRDLQDDGVFVLVEDVDPGFNAVILNGVNIRPRPDELLDGQLVYGPEGGLQSITLRFIRK
ncbi:MAG: hypothetical protein AB2A00_27785 [Myxococcota bacterium]